MQEDPSIAAAKMAAAAALMGGAARMALALNGGTRGVRLVIEGFVGAMLGVIASGVALWFDPALRDAGWPLLIVSAFAGLIGALGTRALDLLEAWVRKKMGIG
jgi:hypothetical protein